MCRVPHNRYPRYLHGVLVALAFSTRWLLRPLRFRRVLLMARRWPRPLRPLLLLSRAFRIRGALWHCMAAFALSNSRPGKYKFSLLLLQAMKLPPYPEKGLRQPASPRLKRGAMLRPNLSLHGSAFQQWANILLLAQSAGLGRKEARKIPFLASLPTSILHHGTHPDVSAWPCVAIFQCTRMFIV